MTDLLTTIATLTQQDKHTQRKATIIENSELNFNIPTLDFGTAWELSGDWMIVGDVHVPSTDWALAEMVASVARKHLRKPRRLLIAGDLFNMDKFTFFPHITMPPSWTEERNTARALLSSWLKTFDEIRWFVGNHERRLQKLMVEVLETTDLLSVIISDPRKTQFSNHSYCWIDTQGGRYLVVHPKNYSRNQLTVARNLAVKKRCHVISFHEHHTSMGWDDSGQSLLVNGGSLVNPNQVAYMSLDISTIPTSKPGFVMLRSGVPTLFGNPPMTDWDLWLR